MQTAKSKTKTPRKLGRSSTLEVLGLPNGRRIPPKWLEHQRSLTEFREQFLQGRCAQTENAREWLSSSTEHIADAATDSYDRDCALALLSSSQNALYEIDQALKRIADGSYGICELTGQPIENARLKAIPWTRFSTHAQAQVEARGAGGRVQLGELGTCLGRDGDDEEKDEEFTELSASADRREAA